MGWFLIKRLGEGAFMGKGLILFNQVFKQNAVTADQIKSSH